MRVEQDIVIDDDGSGQVNAIVAMNFEAIEDMFGGGGGGLGGGFGDAGELGELFGLGGGGDELCNEMARELAAENFDGIQGGDVSEYRDGDFCGVQIAVGLPESNDHSLALADFFDTPRLQKVGDNWEFEATLEDSTEELGDVGDLAGLDDLGLGGDLGGMEALFGGFEYQLSLELPGTAIDGAHNATEVDGGRFTWDVDLLNPPDRFFASTEPGGGFSFPWALLFALLVIGLVIAGVIWFFTNEQANEGTSLEQSLSTGPAMAEATDPYTAAGAAAMGNHTPAQQSMTAANQASTATATLDPVYDESLGAWVVYHPEQGRMRHDPVTGEWLPA